MELDPFEKELRSRREDLDRHSPPEAAWNHIAQESFGQSTDQASSTNYWKVAASILLIVSIGLVIRLFSLESTPSRLGDLSPAYAELESGYLTQIEQLEAQTQTSAELREQLSWIFEELAVLDSVQQDYLKDLQEDQNRDKVIAVLIDHYEKKIKLLKKLELEIQRNNHENELPIS